jgi:hypothetical protein
LAYSPGKNESQFRALRYGIILKPACLLVCRRKRALRYAAERLGFMRKIRALRFGNTGSTGKTRPTVRKPVVMFTFRTKKCARFAPDLRPTVRIKPCKPAWIGALRVPYLIYH